MTRIAKSQEEQILTILRSWSGERLTWSRLRERIEVAGITENSASWSRQALSAKPRIMAAYALAKERGRGRTRKKPPSAKLEATVEELRMKLAELERMYEELLLRHSRLAYNASLLEGGVQLLDMPLPDNTKSQRG